MNLLRVFRYIIPLSFVLLFIINIYTVSLETTLIGQRNSDNDEVKGLYSSENDIPMVTSAKIGNYIIDGETNLSTDKDTYAPGETLTVTAESKTNDMNGSLEWRLESPIGEIPFDFYSDLQYNFVDPDFNNPTIPDWTNSTIEPFTFVDSTSGVLNLTTEADIDEEDNEIYYYNSTALEKGERYIVSFDYFSKGQNLLVNPGLESGDTTGWNVNSSYVQARTDANNASEGSSYAYINGTEGFLIKQNVTSGFTVNREMTFSAKATGTTLDNYWKLRIEAYNSSGIRINFDESADSLGYSIDEKGYAFNKLYWTIPDNTTKIGLIFYGIDDGPDADGLYTGFVDDFYFAEVPPSLMFSYWAEDNQWENITLAGGNNEWETTSDESYTINIGENNPDRNKTFRIFLKDESTATNITTAYWLLDNISVNMVTKPAAETAITIVRNSGTISSTWINRGFVNPLLSTYDIKAEDQEDVAIPPDCEATITIQLPTHQIYFGSWIFTLSIHREDSATSLETKQVNISFVVEEQMNYVLNDVYLLRGSTNQTVENESVYTEYYNNETNIEAISPGDNVAILGYLEANSTLGEWYDLDYLLISSATVEYTWYSTWASKENISWIEPHFITYNKEGETVLDGNFSAPFNNIKSLGLEFKIPERGIFGNLTANLSLTLANTNPKPGNVGGIPLTLEIPLSLPPVRFTINVTDENLPSGSYFLTDYLSGNMTVNMLNYVTNLSEIYSERNITANISIPITDLDLTVILENEDNSEYILNLNTNYIGNTVLWLDKIDPHLIAGSYEFWIRWNTAYKQGISEYDRIGISNRTISIQGTLTIPPITEIIEIDQGDFTSINFTVILSETGNFIGGLNLKGVTSGLESNGTHIVYEEQGVYKIDLDIPYDLEPNDYELKIFITGNSIPLSVLTYRVIEREDVDTNKEEPIDIIMKFGGLVIFLAVGIGAVGALFWANKSIN